MTRASKGLNAVKFKTPPAQALSIFWTVNASLNLGVFLHFPLQKLNNKIPIEQNKFREYPPNLTEN